MRCAHGTDGGSIADPMREPDAILLQIGANVREIRETLGITTKELSDRIRRQGGKVSMETISRLEDARNTPLADKMVWIARGLGCTVDRLYRGISLIPGRGEEFCDEVAHSED